jgi:hypothetical protein
MWDERCSPEEVTNGSLFRNRTGPDGGAGFDGLRPQQVLHDLGVAVLPAAGSVLCGSGAGRAVLPAGCARCLSAPLIVNRSEASLGGMP